MVKMKRFNKLYIIFIFLVLLINGCCMDHNDEITLLKGQSYEIDSKNIKLTVSFDDYYFEEIDDEYILLVEVVTLNPKKEYYFDRNDCNFKKNYGQSGYKDKNDLVKTSIEYNTIKNGYNILENKLTEQTTYQFCYEIPIEVNGYNYNDVVLMVFFTSRFNLAINYDKTPEYQHKSSNQK